MLYPYIRVFAVSHFFSSDSIVVISGVQDVLSSDSCQQKAKQNHYRNHFYQCLIEHRLTQFLPIQPKDDSSQRCSLVTSNEFSRLREVLGSGKSADAKAKAVGLRICLDWSSLKDKEP